MIVGLIFAGVGYFLVNKVKKSENEQKKERSGNKLSPVFYTFLAIGMFLTIIGLMFKIQHWPGVSFLIITGFLLITIGIIIMVSGGVKVSQSRKSAGRKYKFTDFLLMILGPFVVILGALFKIQHWPGSKIFLISGEIITGIGLLIMVMAIIKVNRKK